MQSSITAVSRVNAGKTYNAFFKYFGAKHAACRRYPPPRHDHIIEPFAGSAAYATKYHTRKITLIEKDPIIAGIWEYLIRVSQKEVMALPVFASNDVHIDALESSKPLIPESRALIGMWLFAGAASPRVHRSGWSRNPEYSDRFWGEHIRARIARQVDGIKHWRIICGDYASAKNQGPTTWFIDPPYRVAGKVYVHGNNLDYNALGAWCESRRGQIIVCENEGATWLPPGRDFDRAYSGVANANKDKNGVRGVRRTSKEVWSEWDAP